MPLNTLVIYAPKKQIHTKPFPHHKYCSMTSSHNIPSYVMVTLMAITGLKKV